MNSKLTTPLCAKPKAPAPAAASFSTAEAPDAKWGNVHYSFTRNGRLFNGIVRL
jgi:hypothetical protein